MSSGTPGEAMEDRTMSAVLAKLKQLAGVTIPLEKKVMVGHRLRKRIAKLQLSGVTEYLREVESAESEQQIFIHLLTTHETSFFRTARIWEHFESVLLPEFAARRDNRAMRIWSAAASTGEEPYSIAMSCAEFQRRHAEFQTEIIATDIDTTVLAAAAEGYFEGRNIDRLTATRPNLLGRYFVPRPPGYAVRVELRHSLQFQKHNLMQAPQSQKRHDVVFLRNVLIYFEAPEQMRILQLIARQMLPGATLFLGESESVSQLDVPFRYLRPLVYQRI